MKRALRGTLRGSSPSTRGRHPPPPPLFLASDASSRRTIVSVGNQLSRFHQQRQQPLLQQRQRQWQQGFSSLSTKDAGRDLRLDPLARQHFVAGADGTASRGRERPRGRGRGRGDGGTRFGPGSSRVAVATAGAAAIAAAVTAAAGGKQADCDYPEGTRFGDVYYCSGKALGSGEPLFLQNGVCGVVGRDLSPERRMNCCRRLSVLPRSLVACPRSHSITLAVWCRSCSYELHRLARAVGSESARRALPLPTFACMENIQRAVVH